MSDEQNINAWKKGEKKPFAITIADFPAFMKHLDIQIYHEAERERDIERMFIFETITDYIAQKRCEHCKQSITDDFKNFGLWEE